MIEQDTIRLLRECDAGVKMGVSSIDEVMDHVTDGTMKSILLTGKQDHEKLDYELREKLAKYADEGKNPNPMAKTMSDMKTSFMLAMKDKDATVADLMTDGCNMGVKSLSRYLNQYKAADESSKDITRRLIALEEQMAVDLRPYL